MSKAHVGPALEHRPDGALLIRATNELGAYPARLTNWLSHWAPGMYGIDFPKDTGILMRPGSAVVVQMHYYSAFAPGESDIDTIMHFKVADNVKKPSVNHPLTRNRWLYADDNDSMDWWIDKACDMCEESGDRTRAQQLLPIRYQLREDKETPLNEWVASQMELLF